MKYRKAISLEEFEFRVMENEQKTIKEEKKKKTTIDDHFIFRIT